MAPGRHAYVPNFDCDGKIAVSVSAGQRHHLDGPPGGQSTTQDESDPSIAAGAGGTLYMGWEQGADNAVGSKASSAVSRDHGQTWTDVTDVGARFGINNIQFPE